MFKSQPLYAVVYDWGGNWWPKNGILKCLNFFVFMFFFFNLYGLIQTLYDGILHTQKLIFHIPRQVLHHFFQHIYLHPL